MTNNPRLAQLCEEFNAGPEPWKFIHSLGGVQRVRSEPRANPRPDGVCGDFPRWTPMNLLQVRGALLQHQLAAGIFQELLWNRPPYCVAKNNEVRLFFDFEVIA